MLRAGPWLRRTELVLGLTGFSLLGGAMATVVERNRYQGRQGEILAKIERAPGVVPVGVQNLDPLLVGRIEIPRIGVSAIVREGDDTETLAIAVGHIPGTALPGEVGNVALAGHRDSFFRALRSIEPLDTIRIATPKGDFHYRVSETTIVGPKEIGVLAPTDEPVLTLVTCYPFDFVGSAPKRFIVRAVPLER